ncbi:MAG TPA: hypothetical protein VMW95_04865 [Desulfobacterales bacterium]|nr:hypothetical protein [Desulfobacterales bacterium]
MHFFDEKTSKILEKLTKNLDTKDSIHRFEEMEDASVLTVQNIGNIWIGEDSCSLFSIITSYNDDKQCKTPEIIVMRNEKRQWYPKAIGHNLKNTDESTDIVFYHETHKITNFITDVIKKNILYGALWLRIIAKKHNVSHT